MGSFRGKREDVTRTGNNILREVLLREKVRMNMRYWISVGDVGTNSCLAYCRSRWFRMENWQLCADDRLVYHKHFLALSDEEGLEATTFSCSKRSGCPGFGF